MGESLWIPRATFELVIVDGTLGLVAHDAMKDALIASARQHRELLSRVPLAASGTPGRRIIDKLGLAVQRLKCGPHANV